MHHKRITLSGSSCRVCGNAYSKEFFITRTLCKSCDCEKAKEYYKKHKAEILQKRKNAYSKDRQAFIAKSTKYYKEHKEAVDATKRAYRLRNKEKWRVYSAYKTASRRKEIRAYYKLLPKEEKYKIQLLYKISSFISRTLSVTMHVDHIIPISKGGLHHSSNLRVIPAIENQEKFTRVDLNLITTSNFKVHQKHYGETMRITEKGIIW